MNQTNSAAIDAFIKKVRLAQKSKVKDVRLSLEEATDLVNWIALINTNADLLHNIDTKVELISKMVTSIPIISTASNLDNNGINGGSF